MELAGSSDSLEKSPANTGCLKSDSAECGLLVVLFCFFNSQVVWLIIFA